MKKLIAFIIFLSVVFSSFGNVNAVEPSSSLKSKNFRFDSDLKIIGVFGSNTFFFNVDDYWKVKDAYFNLVFTQSELLQEEYSTLTVSINGMPQYSMNLADKKSYKESINIPIHNEYITKGYNSVKVQLYRRLSEKPCIDDTSAGNWLILHKDSFVHIDFEDKISSNTIEEYPFPFMKASDENPVNSIILLPDNFDKSEATASMIIAGSFGSQRKFDNIDMKVFKVSDGIEKAESNDVIFIGKKDNTPEVILNTLNQDELNLLQNSAVIKEVESPYNKDKKIMAIVSNNAEYLIKASKLLCNKDLLKQVKNNSIIVDKDMNISTVIKDKGDNITLQDLGYENITLEGLFRQQTTIGVSLPKNRIIKDTSKIVLNCRYSKNIDFQKSLMTVYINDIPIGSKALSIDKSDDDKMEINIPEEVKKSNYYEIKVTFDLEQKDVFCSLRQENMPWAHIANSSYIYVPYKEGNDFIFENYSNPFAANGQYKDSVVILSNNPSSDELTMVANIISFIAHDVDYNNGNLDVITAGDFSNKYYNKNLIIVGSPANNKIIKDVNKSLYIKYDSSFNYFASNEKVNLMPNYSKTLSAIELIDSPYSKNFKAMVVTAPDVKNLYSAQKYITDLTFIKKLKGDTVLIDVEGNSNSYYLNDKNNKKLQNINTINAINLSGQIKLLILFFAFLILFIVLVAMMIIRKNKKNKY